MQTTTCGVTRDMLCGYEGDLKLDRYLIVAPGKKLEIKPGVDLSEVKCTTFVERKGSTLEDAILEAKMLALGSRKKIWNVWAVRFKPNGILLDEAELLSQITRYGPALLKASDSTLRELAETKS